MSHRHSISFILWDIIITDHSTIVFNLKTSAKAAPKIKRRVYDYTRGNFDGLRAALEALDLCSVIESEVIVQEGWMKWKELFLKAAYENIPTKTIKNMNCPPWINAEIIHAIQKKAVHFLRIPQWWGKTAKGPIFLALPQNSMRSPKVWGVCGRHELAKGVWGHAPRRKYLKFGSLKWHFLHSENRFFFKSQLLKTKL